MSTGQRAAIDRTVAAALLTALAALAPAACTQAESAEVEHYQPSKISPGENGHPVVTITKLGAEQIGLETVPISETNTIPYAAMLYDADGGQPYVFVNTEGLSFERKDITVQRIKGDVIKLSAGPDPGTRVVTVGLPQIHGAELEFGAY